MVLRFRDSRGFALLLTIMVISLLVAITMEFNASMRDELMSAVNVHDGMTLKATARSGVDLAMAVLYEKAVAGGADSFHDDWADQALLTSLLSSLCVEGRGQLLVTDASRKINVNKLLDQNGVVNQIHRDVLRRFLSFEDFRLGLEEIEDLLDAITDWLDVDDEVTRFGAESSYYLSLDRPYTCRNGAMQSLEELLLVRGVTPELFYGTEDVPGIESFLTVSGDGKVNINTAHPLVLWSLSEEMDFEMARDMAAYRESEDNDLSDPSWYRQVAGMAEVSLDPGITAVVSSHFEISSAGIKGEMRRFVSAVVEKSDRRVRLISWKAG
jgi:general secretion pathway protein K